MANPLLVSTFANNFAYSSPSNPWDFSFTSKQVQEQFVSTVAHILQSILYNGTSSLLNFNNFDVNPGILSSAISPTSEAVNMTNLTFAMLSETFEKYMIRDENGNPSYSPGSNLLLQTLLQLGSLAQYFVTFGITLSGGWAVNRFTLKSQLLTDVLETVISFLIFLPIFPAVFLIFLAVLGARICAFLYLSVIHPGGKLFLMNGVDGFWAYETHASCSTCNGLYVIEGTCDLEKIRQRTKETIQSDLVGGKMNRKLTSFWGFPAWETIPMENVDMEKYVKVVRMGDTDSPMEEEDVFHVIRTVQDKPIENMAPWEMFVIPHFAYKSGESESDLSMKKVDAKKTYYAVIFRLHHSIMDGISTANILHSVMADKPFTFSFDPTRPFGPNQSAPPIWVTGLMYFLGLISIPRIILGNMCMLDSWNNKYYRPGPQLTGPKMITWSRALKMDALKEIKNLTQTSIYAVLLSSLGGACRKYYIKSGKSLPVNNFHVLFPVALLPYPDRKPRNRFAGIVVPTQVGGGPCTPRERLETNYTALRALGTTSRAFLTIANWYLPAALGLLPLFLHKPLSCLVHVKMTLSNVPGPSEDVWIYGGGKIVDIGIWLPIKYSLGFGMGLFSYKDKVRATVIADRAYYAKDSDIQFLIRAFENELSALGESVGIRDIFMEQ